MSSISFMKLHGVQEVRAMIRHCDKEERKKHQHSNQDIDISKADSNHQLMSYTQTMKWYQDRIKQIDNSAKSTNKRKDRVTCFALNIPYPEGLTEAHYADFEKLVKDFLVERYGRRNLVGAYAHYDEMHEYLDHGERRTSRPHIHAFVVPEIDGKLNGKKFSSKQSMIESNKALHERIKENFELEFMTHKKPRKMSVEELKMASLDELEKAIVAKKEELQKYEQIEDIAIMYEEELERERVRERQRSR